MGMMDLLTQEQAEEALQDSIKTRAAFIKEMHKLDNLIFFLKYYLNTGEALNPDVLELPGDEEND